MHVMFVFELLNIRLTASDNVMFYLKWKHLSSPLTLTFHERH